MKSREKIFKLLNGQNLSIENSNGYYTVVSPCNCSSCKNFCMSIYRDDNDLYTRVWVTNDEELIMASHFFKDVMELPNSLSQTIFNQLSK